MTAVKCYLALLLTCLVQVSLAVPMPADPVARNAKGPVADQFGGSGGGPPDW